MTHPPTSTVDSQAPVIWDLPTRLFHWLLVLLLVGSFLSAKAGGLWIDWHFRAGYAILALIAFRIIWGFVGGRYARFRSFVFGPRQFLAYLRGAPGSPAGPGHNPLGALSVFAMLLLVGAQAVLGLFANDDIASEGPLASQVSKRTSDYLTGLHLDNEPFLLGLIGLHVVAIAWYRLVRGRKLVAAMITGRDPQAPAGTASSRDDARLRLAALGILAVIAFAVWLLVR
ncbi:MAG: cytochrome b/b6 domain-containing protein [Burkholderiaceae bacterium]